MRHVLTLNTRYETPGTRFFSRSKMVGKFGQQSHRIIVAVVLVLSPQCSGLAVTPSLGFKGGSTCDAASFCLKKSSSITRQLVRFGPSQAICMAAKSAKSDSNLFANEWSHARMNENMQLPEATTVSRMLKNAISKSTKSSAAGGGFSDNDLAFLGKFSFAGVIPWLVLFSASAAAAESVSPGAGMCIEPYGLLPCSVSVGGNLFLMGAFGYFLVQVS
jgi:hypothetical protein